MAGANDQENSYIYGSAIAELASIVMVCLEHGASASTTIDTVIAAADMGCAAYPVQWIPLEPRQHYFRSFGMALANALLFVPSAVRAYLEQEGLLFKDLLIAVSRHISSDDVFHVYAVVVGLHEVFSHVTVEQAVRAAKQDQADGEADLGF